MKTRTKVLSSILFGIALFAITLAFGFSFNTIGLDIIIAIVFDIPSCALFSVVLYKILNKTLLSSGRSTIIYYLIVLIPVHCCLALVYKISELYLYIIALILILYVFLYIKSKSAQWKKRKTILISSIIVTSSLIISFVLRGAFLYIGKIADQHTFGDEYIQIVYPTSISDYITAKTVLKEANAALSTITTREQAVQEFGKLGYLCVTDSEAVKETHKIDLIAANFKGTEGYMWVEYYSEAYDSAGHTTYGSWGILSRWELSKIDNKWVVTSFKEHP